MPRGSVSGGKAALVAKLNGSELADARVSACIVHEFVGLRYPSPEGDRISVVYPLVFAPDEGDAGADAR